MLVAFLRLETAEFVRIIAEWLVKNNNVQL